MSKREVIRAVAICAGAVIAMTPAAGAGAASAWATAVGAQSLDDAWWTGSISAPSAATLPKGHYVVEPYFYDAITYGHYDSRGTRVAGPREHHFGSFNFLNYGLIDRVSVGLMPQFGFRIPEKGPNSSGIGTGDLGVQVQYRLTQFQQGRWVPTASLLLIETLPTGRYDRLSRASDGGGSGAYSTAVALYLQDYFWMPTGRILRTRLDLTYGVMSWAKVRDASVYGTAAGFRGHARPGNPFTVDFAVEYSLTRNWVLANDVLYEHDNGTRVVGSYPSPQDKQQRIAYQLRSASSESLALVPAVEYNFSGKLGVIFGARVFPWGRNASASLTPVVAINMVF